MKTLKIDSIPGFHIDDAILDAIKQAIEEDAIVVFDFNGVEVKASPDSKLEDIRASWQQRMDDQAAAAAAQRAAYLASPQGIAETARKRAEAEAKAIRRAPMQAARVDGLCPFSFAPGAAEKWAEGLAKNSDPYGRAVYTYASGWAFMMERAMAAGSTVADCAKAASHDADVEGITGFMYGCAVSILSACWEHGEQLRRWHNGEYGHAGDGVVNPAILTLGNRQEPVP